MRTFTMDDKEMETNCVHYDDTAMKKQTKSVESSGHDDDCEPLLPPRPTEPDPSDCCGTGCTPCVYDLYEQELRMWEAECLRIRQGSAASIDPKVLLSPDHYTEFELTDIEPLTADSNLYTFSIPGYQTLSIGLGQHLVLRWLTEKKVFTRQYTPITPPGTNGKLVFVIKLYDDGEMSQYIRTWRVGDRIEWRGPFGNFTYRRNAYKRIVMFAAGTGIAPMLQILQNVVEDENDDTRLHLVYACRSHSAILCKSLLDELKCYWNVSMVYYLSQSSSEESLHSCDDIIHSRLTKNHVISELGPDANSTRVLVCGTKSFDKDVINFIKSAGVTEDCYFKF